MRFQLNIDKLMFETDGVWDMPLLEAAQTTFTGAEEVIPFNYAITERQPQIRNISTSTKNRPGAAARAIPYSATKRAAKRRITVNR